MGVESEMVKINGVEGDFAGISVGEYPDKNGEIVPKAKYDSTALADGDVLEVVSFVGGG